MANFLKEAYLENWDQVFQAETKRSRYNRALRKFGFGRSNSFRELIFEGSQQLNIFVRIMDRPRGGNFLYSAQEISMKIASIEFCKAVGVEEVVFGILNSYRKLNIEIIKKLTDIATPLKVVIYKAIDHTVDPLESLVQLTKIKGITKLLVSGEAKQLWGRRKL